MRRLGLLLPLIAVATLHATDPVLPPLVFDQGAAGAWQKILKLQTTASVLTRRRIPTTSTAAH
jgi:hypothetical protein